MTHTDWRKLLAELDFERLAGSEGEERARRLIGSRLDSWGVPYELEPFELTTFLPGTAVLREGGRTWDLVPYGLEKDAEIEGELAFLENADVLSFNQGAWRGKIVLSYGGTLRIPEMAADGGLKAFLAISGPLRGASSLSHRQKWFEDGKAVPSFSVGYDDAEGLLKLSGRTVRIEVRQEVRKAAARNIVVSLGRKVRDETLTYLVGHYDSVARSRGATDNAAGVAAMLSAVEHFHAEPPDRELRVVFFSGEELGLRGSFAHTRSRAEELKSRGRLVVNADVSGDLIGTDRMIVTGTREILGWAGGVLRESGLVFQESLDIYSSDGIPFSVYEVPCINLARGNGKGSFYIHTDGDTARHTRPAGIAHTADAVRTLLGRVLGAEVFPLKKEIDDSLREKIEKYIWGTLLEKPELQWTEKYRK